MTFPILPVWKRWKDLTTFLALSDHVLLSQKEQWQALPLADKDTIQIVREDGPYRYQTDGKTYDAVLSDRHMLSSLVLLNSYALIETAVRQVYAHLVPLTSASTPILVSIRGGTSSVDDLISSGGIETWGTKLLTDIGRDWTYVESGKAGLVEAAIARNAIAHGETVLTQSMQNRAASVGATIPWAVGSELKLDIPTVKEYRHRLRSFARVIEHGGRELL